jgi:menaquinone-dependent protoporphyrinogen oxidase
MHAAIFFATREGQTRRVADRIAAGARAAGATVDVFDLRTTRQIDLSKYDSVCIAASVHIGKHEREAVEFVKEHHGALDRLPAAFVSVSLSEAGAEDVRRPADERARSAADVQQMIRTFVKDTGWHPARVLPVAGALAYTRYNWLVRWVMKQIARKAGAPTDTSRDHELTNWGAVDRFALSFATQ